MKIDLRELADPLNQCPHCGQSLLASGRIAELEELLQLVLHHGPIVPIQLAADIVAAGITRPARSTEPRS